jgi:hypothetical protein
MCCAGKQTFGFVEALLSSENKTRNGDELVLVVAGSVTFCYLSKNKTRNVDELVATVVLLHGKRTTTSSPRLHLTHKTLKTLKVGWDTGTIVISPSGGFPGILLNDYALKLFQDSFRFLFSSIAFKVGPRMPIFGNLLDGKIVATPTTDAVKQERRFSIRVILIMKGPVADSVADSSTAQFL